MAKAFQLLPCRYNRDLGWITCTPERATGWAVASKPGAVHIARFQTKKAAREHLDRLTRLAAPPRKHQLGIRPPLRLAAHLLFAQGAINPRKQ